MTSLQRQDKSSTTSLQVFKISKFSKIGAAENSSEIRHHAAKFGIPSEKPTFPPISDHFKTPATPRRSIPPGLPPKIILKNFNQKERLNLRDSLEQASSYSYSPSFTLSRLQTIATILPFHSIPYNLLSFSLPTKVFLHEIRSISLRDRIVV